MRKALLISFVLAFALCPTSILACGCVSLSNETFETTIGNLVSSSVAVFHGKVIGFEYRKGIFNEYMSEKSDPTGKAIKYETKIVRFKSDLWWKGYSDSEIELVTSETRNSDGTGSTDSCDFHFTEGESYTVFAYLDKSTTMPRTDSCRYTKQGKVTQEYLKALGEGTLVLPTYLK